MVIEKCIGRNLTFLLISVSILSDAFQLMPHVITNRLQDFPQSGSVLFSEAKRPKRSSVSGMESCLYDILDLNPSASREVIKKRYIDLAKILHPDSNISDEAKQTSTFQLSPGYAYSFSDVASAYKILSNPKEKKKYDRELRAKAITKDIEMAAENFFTSMVQPMFRNARATTIKAQKEIQKNKRRVDEKGFDFSSVTSALQSGIDAEEIVDNLELVQKAQQLEQRYQEDSNAAQDLRLKLHQVTRDRLRLSLYTPDALLEAEQASEILENINTTASMASFDQSAMRTMCEQEIEILYMKEKEYLAIAEEAEEAIADHVENVESVERCEKALSDATLAEAKAREALKAATEAVKNSESMLNACYRASLSTEKESKKLVEKADRFRGYRDRQMERVRGHLKDKADKLAEVMGIDVDEMLSDNQSIPESMALTEGLSIKEMMKLEKRLINEATFLEQRAERELSRASKLRKTADKVFGQEKSNDDRIRDDGFTSTGEGMNVASEKTSELEIERKRPLANEANTTMVD